MKKLVFVLCALLVLVTFVSYGNKLHKSVENQVIDRLVPPANATPTVFPVAIYAQRIQAKGLLLTQTYEAEAVFQAEVRQGMFGWLVGDKIQVFASGKVTAGVDLSNLSENDVRFSDGVLTIRIPHAKVLDSFLDESKTFVVNRSTGLIAKPEATLEDTLRQEAINTFMQEALQEYGILRKADEEAIRIFQNLFTRPEDGINKVVVVITTD